MNLIKIKNLFRIKCLGQILVLLLCVNTCYAEAIKKEEIEIGIFASSLYDLDSTKGSFGADIWIWSLSKNVNFDLKKVEVFYLNTKHPHYYELDHSNNLGKDGRYSARKLSGTFLHNFNLEKFPFDRQTLEFHIEHTQEYADTWAFVSDPQSGIDKSIVIDGWFVQSANTVLSRKKYDTNFGMIEKNPEFSRVTLKVDIKRQAPFIFFFKLTLGLLVAVAIAIFACLLPSTNSELFSARVGLLGATLLAVVVSQQFADSQAGDTSSVTLVDWLHMLGTVCILILFGSTLVSRLIFIRNNNRKISLVFDRFIVFSICALFFVISIIFVYDALKT
jgi:hypothetical protein